MQDDVKFAINKLHSKARFLGHFTVATVQKLGKREQIRYKSFGKSGYRVKVFTLFTIHALSRE